ncbi:hypothetical protein TA3x_004279 [Tundrisphaera sp. TA3]|uniref:hypothetical protein n=1 Tax=Tundrisphaera sp. TA3 TaxID=3435775 RepID=UPI003EBB4B4F
MIQEQIKELYRKQLDGEITEEECMSQSLELAKNLSAQPESHIIKIVDYVESNPKMVLAIVAGICHGVRHHMNDKE